MSYEYTDQQLNYLNRGNNVYSVNQGFVKRNSTNEDPLLVVTDKPDDKLKPGEINKVETPDQRFQVIKTHSDPKTGFDGMAVAPIVNGKPDYNHVAIVAAGTDPNSNDWNIPIYQHYQVGMEAPLVMNVQQSKDVRSAIIAKYTNLSPQYDPAEQFLRTVQQMPGVRVTKLTGYSQGIFVIKLGAKYGIPTTTFNAWFDYSALSPSEQQFLKEHPYMFVNYRKKKDEVVSWNDFNKPWRYYDDYGTIYWVDGSSHKIDDWYFDPVTGQTLDGKGGRPLVTSVSYYQSISTMQMKHFASLKSQWKKSGGKLSSSEKIFLDAIQAQMLGANMASSARSGAEEASLLQTKAIQDVQDVWNKIDFSSYTELTPWEVEAAFTSYGVTRDFVSEFQTESQEMVEKMMASAEQFDTLKTQLDQAIASLQEADSQLAGDFKAWEQGM